MALTLRAMGIFSAKGRKLADQSDQNPESMKNHLPKIQELLQGRSSDGQVNGAYALSSLAEVNPSAARTLVSDYFHFITNADRDKLRANATSVVRCVAAEYLKEVMDAQDNLITALKSDGFDLVRLNAALALGHLGTKEAYEALRVAKDTEQDAEVKSAIFEALTDSESSASGTDSSDSGGVGMLMNCANCSTDFGELPGIHRQCPGCGTPINQML